MVKVSVVVPVYNVEKYITNTVRSVLNQTLHNLELILVDDCSTDNSLKICQKLSITDDRIKVIAQSANVGPMQSRQLGVEKSSGDYYFFLDSDDTLPPRALEILYETAIRTGSEIIKGHMNVVHNNGQITPFGEDYLPYQNNTEGILRALLEGKLHHNLASALFSKTIIKSYDYIIKKDMRNGEDGLLFYQLIQNIKTPLVIIPDIVYNYHMVDGSSSHRRISDVALKGLVFFYDYVSNLQYPSLKQLALRYSTYNINEFALTQGYSRVNNIVKQYSKHPYLSLIYRLKYMSIIQNIRWYIKFIVK